MMAASGTVTKGRQLAQELGKAMLKLGSQSKICSAYG
jgi:hypothetical protein